jgi:hypothetical protein
MRIDGWTRVTVSVKFSNMDNQGICGVFEDIKNEYKAHVNQSHELVQLLKSEVWSKKAL